MTSYTDVKLISSIITVNKIEIDELLEHDAVRKFACLSVSRLSLNVIMFNFYFGDKCWTKIEVSCRRTCNVGVSCWFFVSFYLMNAFGFYHVT